MRLQFTADAEGIRQGVEAVQAFLAKKGLRNSEQIRAMLAAEESMIDLVDHAGEGACLRVTMGVLFGVINIEFSAQGKAYDFSEKRVGEIDDLWAYPDSSAEMWIRNSILRNYTKNLRYRNSNGVNSISLTVRRSSRSLWTMLGVLCASILLGILMPMVFPAYVNNGLSEYLLTPINSMYMNALKMIAAPVVFLSIVGCVSDVGNPKELGRIGGKVLGMWVYPKICVNEQVGAKGK